MSIVTWKAETVAPTQPNRYEIGIDEGSGEIVVLGNDGCSVIARLDSHSSRKLAEKIMRVPDNGTEKRT